MTLLFQQHHLAQTPHRFRTRPPRRSSSPPINVTWVHHRVNMTKTRQALMMKHPLNRVAIRRWTSLPASKTSSRSSMRWNALAVIFLAATVSRWPSAWACLITFHSFVRAEMWYASSLAIDWSDQRIRKWPTWTCPVSLPPLSSVYNDGDWWSFSVRWASCHLSKSNRTSSTNNCCSRRFTRKPKRVRKSLLKTPELISEAMISPSRSMAPGWRKAFRLCMVLAPLSAHQIHPRSSIMKFSAVVVPNVLAYSASKRTMASCIPNFSRNICNGAVKQTTKEAAAEWKAHR